MKVAILGASGIVGQHMRLHVPPGVKPSWFRQHRDLVTQAGLAEGLMQNPDVVVNLAGQSNVDIVEREPHDYSSINVLLPKKLAEWCEANGKKYVHVSSQAVFSGTQPPYFPSSVRRPVNEYGRQKLAAEDAVYGHGAVLVRLSTVLGIRPLPHVGRTNPLEAILAGQSPQVGDRWFSPLMAEDAALILWEAVLNAKPGAIYHCGVPERASRADVARSVGADSAECTSYWFPDAAPRPIDTTYAYGSRFFHRLEDLSDMIEQQKADDRAIELSIFFGIRLDEARAKLSQGFGPLHNAVSDDFRVANPQGDEALLLSWYRTTESYIWELSAYHEDAGFNYLGMCSGIATRLKNEPNCKRVLCLGDGIGDLTLALDRAGFDATYHDLAGSRTQDYAEFRFWRNTGREIQFDRTANFEPALAANQPYDAIVSLDFLEHVPNVEEWVRAVHAALRPGGLFAAQNAFAIGSGPDGDMPMHLAINDRFEKDWDKLLIDVGFEQLAPQWYRRKA